MLSCLRRKLIVLVSFGLIASALGACACEPSDSDKDPATAPQKAPKAPQKATKAPQKRCQLQLSRTSVQVGPLGSSRLTLTNRGDFSCRLVSMSWGAKSGTPFVIDAGQKVLETLLPQQSRHYSIYRLPANQRQQDTLTIHSSDPTNPRQQVQFKYVPEPTVCDKDGQTQVYRARGSMLPIITYLFVREASQTTIQHLKTHKAEFRKLLDNSFVKHKFSFRFGVLNTSSTQTSQLGCVEAPFVNGMSDQNFEILWKQLVSPPANEKNSGRLIEAAWRSIQKGKQHTCNLGLFSTEATNINFFFISAKADRSPHSLRDYQEKFRRYFLRSPYKINALLSPGTGSCGTETQRFPMQETPRLNAMAHMRGPGANSFCDSDWAQYLSTGSAESLRSSFYLPTPDYIQIMKFLKVHKNGEYLPQISPKTGEVNWRFEPEQRAIHFTTSPNDALLELFYKVPCL